MAKKVTTTTTTVTTEIIPDSPKRTYVAFVLDRSGSMGAIREQAINLFNEQLQIVKNKQELGGETLVSLIVFETDVLVQTLNQKPDDIPPLTMATYVPGASTALYDGIGTAIALLQQFDTPDANVGFLIVAVTDGMENASKEYSGTKLSGLIRKLQATDRWTFTVMGANVNLAQLAGELHIPQGNMQYFTSTAAGTAAASGVVMDALSSYMADRSVGTTSKRDFYQPDPAASPGSITHEK